MLSNAAGKPVFSETPQAFLWLFSDAGLKEFFRWLERKTEFSDELKLTAALRKEFSSDRASALAGQILIQDKVQKKFPGVAALFATEKGIQQSTDAAIAQYKAQAALLPADSDLSFADLCCGIGGDLLGFSARFRAWGADADPLTALMAQTNCRLAGLKTEVFCSLAEQADVSKCEIIHIDPDRRPAGHRTTQADYFLPPLETINHIITSAQRVIIKSAPGADIPPEWQSQAHWEWIEHNGECRQAVGWFGFESAAFKPGNRSAVMVDNNGGAVGFTANYPAARRSNSSQKHTGAIPSGAYIYDPAPALCAADLVGAFAKENGLEEIPQCAYLTGKNLVVSPLVSAFVVDEDLPLDPRRVKAALKQRGWENVVIKKRGAVPEPDSFRKKLGVSNRALPNAPVLLLFERHAVLAQRTLN